MAEHNSWPPVAWLWEEYRKNLAWYSGKPDRLRTVSGTEATGKFWASDETVKVHVPVAADIVALGAGMIFAESPKIECEDERTQERIDDVCEKNGLYSKLLQAAELGGVCGGVFMKWTWNVDDGRPKLHVVPADCGLPVWRGGELYQIRLWNIVREDDDTGNVWRTEETYTHDGHILTVLHKGDANNLGDTVPLGSIPETEGVAEDANSGTGMLLAVYVPNLLPNRDRPHVLFGRSDYDGLLGMFDELDEAYSSIQRETRLTKTTVIVPAEYLRKRDAIFGVDNPHCKANQWVYSNNTGAFVALDIDSGQTSSPVTVINPDIRAEQHIAICEDLIRRIWQMAGYSPQSAGMDVTGSAESGTALSMRERKTIRTTEVKKTHWWHALHHLMRGMLKLDAAVFQSGVDPNAELTIELPSNAQPDISQMAEILEQLERAGAISTEMKIELLHPDWDAEKRAAELERIRSETAAPAQTEIDRILTEPANEGGEE